MKTLKTSMLVISGKYVEHIKASENIAEVCSAESFTCIERIFNLVSKVILVLHYYAL